MTVRICGGSLDEKAWKDCPACKKRGARWIIGHAVSPYYAPTYSCECGDSFDEDGRCVRPFSRGWRERAKAEFEKRWANASAETPIRCESCLYIVVGTACRYCPVGEK